MNINIHDTGMALRIAMHMGQALAEGIGDAIKYRNVSYIGDGICDGVENILGVANDKIDSVDRVVTGAIDAAESFCNGVGDFFDNLFW